MGAEFTPTQPKVLMIGVYRLVLDNVRVLLGTMRCQCVIGSSIKEALGLLEEEKPEAAIIDMQVLASAPAQTLLDLHKFVLGLRGRAVVLTSAEWDLQLPVLDAYCLPKVSVDLLFQELVPCLELLLRGNIAPRQKIHSARLVFDSSLQPLPAGVRSAPPTDHRLLYESGDVMVDLWLEPYRDSGRINLVGQILHEIKSGSLLYCAPVVLQSKVEPIEATTTNELGEFHLDFDPHPHLRLEIGVRENQWVSVELPDSSNAARESQ
ncbi:MAG: hypothetical protein DMG40_26260 [Acidobacteria bacterium]|nr:MAG: hypothetical protein DMG40_26260 [Acidobacteriota bacterium]